MSPEDMTVERLDRGWRIALDEVYRTDQADLWSACTEADRLARWMAPYRGDLRLGGTWQALADGGVWGTGTVTACDPPNGFTTTWTAEGEATSTLAVTLEAVEGGTRLCLVHDAIASPYYAPGWAAYVAMLADHLADPGRSDLGDAGFDARFASLQERYAPLTEAAGLR